MGSSVPSESLYIKRRVKIGNLWERVGQERTAEGEQEKVMFSVVRCDIASHDHTDL